MAGDLGVVVWKSRTGSSNLSRCLRALRSQGGDIGEIVVVEPEYSDVSSGFLRRALRRKSVVTRSAPVLVDGDGPPDVATGPPVVVRARSVGVTLNAGARRVSGDLIAFVGADVEVQPGWAAAMKAALDRAGVAGGNARSTRSQAREDDWTLGDPIGRNGFLPWGSARNLAVRRAVFEDLGGFEERLPLLEDADLCFRAQFAGYGFAPVADGRVLTDLPTRAGLGTELQDGRAETLLFWRYRENPYFATRPFGRDRRGLPAVVGNLLGWAQLVSGERPVADMIVAQETHRHVVMPLVLDPTAVVTMRPGQDVTALVGELRDRHGLSAGLPGPDIRALDGWDEVSGWALAATRAARAAGWGFEPRIAARRLEQQRPKTAGAELLTMGGVLAWYQGQRGFVLLASRETAPRLTERLPDVPVIDLARGDDLATGLRGGLAPAWQPGRAPSVTAGRWHSRHDHPRVHRPVVHRPRGRVGQDRRLVAEPTLASSPLTWGDGPAAAIAAGMTKDPALLVSGCPRSGTTLLRNMLAAHPALAAPVDEGNFVTRTFGLMKLAHTPYDLGWAWERIKIDRHFDAWDLDIDLLDAVIAKAAPSSYADLMRILYNAVAVKEDKPLSADKCTSYSMHWEWLAEQFPTTKFVHVVRDPRDVCMSLPLQYFHHGGVSGAAWWWLLHTWGTPKVAAALGDRWLEIRYEDLVADPVGQLDTVCGHIGLDFDEAMLRYSEAKARPGGAHRHADSEAPRQGIRSWRQQLSHDDLVTIERTTGHVMTRFGYEPVTTGITPGAVEMTMRFLIKEARNQWLLSGAPRPGMVENLLALRWRPEL
jgi:hypothetical protein